MMSLLKKVRNKSTRTCIWMEYTKAELKVKTEQQVVDSKTGMELNTQQLREKEIERREEALSIVQRSLQQAQSLDDPHLTYEGCLLLWNLSLPFINMKYKEKVYKGFNTACGELERISSTDYDLRVKLHFELSKLELTNSSLHAALENVRKAMRLAAFKDWSPCWEYLVGLESRILLKKNSRLAAGSPLQNDTRAALDMVQMELEKSRLLKSESARYDSLSRCFKLLLGHRPSEFKVEDSRLVMEEIQTLKTKFEVERRREFKKKNLLMSELLSLAVEFGLFELAHSAGKFVVAQTWPDPKEDLLMLVKQSESWFTMAQAGILNLGTKGYHFAFVDEPEVSSQGGFSEYSDEELLRKKKSIIKAFESGAVLAESIAQYWMVFDGAITLWNCYLPIFKNSLNDGALLPEIKGMLKCFFECMQSSVKDIEKQTLADYDRDSKIQVYGNLTIVYARLLERDQKFERVREVTDSLLLAPLSAQTRKMVNSARARVFSTVEARPPARAGKKEKPQKRKAEPGNGLVFEVASKIEIIQNNNSRKEPPKTALYCAEQALTFATHLSRGASADARSKVSRARVRWYSIADFLYSKALCRLLEGPKLRPEAQQELFLRALKHALEAGKKGFKAKESKMVRDALKQFQNIIRAVAVSEVKGKIMPKLAKPIFSIVYYLKMAQENSEEALKQEELTQLTEVVFELIEYIIDS